MALDYEWDRDLKHKVGGPTRLEGIDVYYDFNWFKTFRHDTAQFPKGQCAARQVKALCPLGKTPALLLTENEDAPQGFFETPLHLILVLNLPKYLDAPADPSLSYLAGLVGSGITRIGRLSDLAEVDPDDLRDFLDLRLNSRLIEDWLSDRRDRLSELRNIPGVSDVGDREVALSEAIAALESLDGLPADAQKPLHTRPQSVSSSRYIAVAGSRAKRVRLLPSPLTDGAWLCGCVRRHHSRATPGSLRDSKFLAY